MKEGRDGIWNDKNSKSSLAGSLPLILDVDDFKGDFSFDALFGNLVNNHLPSFQEEEADSVEGHGSISGSDAFANGHVRAASDATKFAQGLSSPLFPEVDSLLSLFRDSCRELIDLRTQVGC
uniref:Exocyst complex component SEC10-like n=1 Tax=Rhizophora mucronata TaxID=61149 RepID=A0A2P2M2G4_RHIMU